MATRSLSGFAGVLVAAVLAGPASSQVLYTETFDDGNAASRWTTSPSGNPNSAINYAFDYASAGIPAAPGGTSTTGLKMEVNTSGSAIGSLMAFPNAQNFSGNHTLAFDVWFNVTGTVATTEFGIFGLNHTSTTAQTPTGATPGVGPSPNGIDYAASFVSAPLPVPEPATAALALAGLVAVLGRTRRRLVSLDPAAPATRG